MDRQYLYENLLDWIRVFKFVSADVDISLLLDGEIISEILYKIEPSYFTEEWKSKLLFNPESNWRLKASNMKKIIAAMSDFLMNLNVPLDDFSFPNGVIMCENRDSTELSRLLQLLLLCAVNCQQKELYIQDIMSMESSKQLVIMRAIQEFMLHDSSCDMDEKAGIKCDEISFLKQEKEVQQQKCHDLEFKMSLLIDEKSVLEEEVKRLTRQIDGNNRNSNSKFMSDSPFESDNVGPESMRIRQLQERLCGLQSELFRLEHYKEETDEKLEYLEKENSELLEKMENLNEEISQYRYTKDELDITKEKLKYLTGIEMTLEKYKKHIDDSSDLVRHNRQLELENSNFLDRLFKLEEELKKMVSLKDQIEMYKDEISQIQSVCSRKEKEFDKSDFELKRLSEKIVTLDHQNTALQEEIRKLQEENEYVHHNVNTIADITNSDRYVENHSMNSMDEYIDMLEIPVGMRERVIRLQNEVKKLRRIRDEESHQNVDTDSRNHEQLMVYLEASQSRLKQMSAENKELHQENLILNAKLEDQVFLQDEKNIEKDTSIEDCAAKIEETELKYKGYLEKAKYVIYHLHRKLLRHESNVETPTTPIGEHDTLYSVAKDKGSYTKDDYMHLKEAFLIKERQLEELQNQYDTFQTLREEEEKMVVAAWYNLGVRVNRDAAQERLRPECSDNLVTFNKSEPNSFLAKQRMAHMLSSNRWLKNDSMH